jgi:SM-20-related protein
VTPKELMDSLPETLMRDDRILSARERELLANVIHHARSYGDAPENRVAESIARAIGETVAQRAFSLLGDRILQRLEEEPRPAGELLAGLHLGTGPLPVPSPPSPQTPGPHPPSPSPPTSPNAISARRRESSVTPFGEPQPPSRSRETAATPWGQPQPPGRSRETAATPFGEPQPPSRSRVKTESASSFVGPHPPAVASAQASDPSVAPFVGPQPPGMGSSDTSSASSVEGSDVAVMESEEILPARCVIFEEFLVPAELEMLTRYALQHEANFRVSEVLSPVAKGGIVDHEYRRSRVLDEPGQEINALMDRIKACLPRVLPKLELSTFPVAREEVQITASNHGDFFRWHSDNAQEEIASREITFVYFFHREPKQFRGGELRIYDSLSNNGAYIPTTSYRVIVPRQNQIVFFRSSLAHEITPIECPSGEFGDSRFTVNGWFHR